MPTVALFVLRVLLVIMAIALGVGLINSPLLPKDPAWIPWMVFAGCLIAAGIVIALDVFVRRKRIETMSAVYFGLLVGVLLTYVVRWRCCHCCPIRQPFQPGIHSKRSRLFTGCKSAWES